MNDAYTEVQHLSGPEFAELVGDAKMKCEPDRTDLEKVLVKCEAQLKTMRSKAERAHALVREVGLENPPVLPFRAYQGLDRLKGSALDAITGDPIACTFTEYVHNPDLHMQYVACLLGKGGLGKTPLCKSACVYWAVSYQGKFYGTPPEKCYYLQCNTVDMLKEFKQGGVLKSWTPIFLDEFQAADIKQQGIVGENGLKVLCEAWEGGTIRARYHDIILPTSVPRIFAANVASSAAWLNHLGVDDMHRIPIMKRVMFFHVTTALVPEQMRNKKLVVLDTGLKDALAAGLSYMG